MSFIAFVVSLVDTAVVVPLVNAVAFGQCIDRGRDCIILFVVSLVNTASMPHSVSELIKILTQFSFIFNNIFNNFRNFIAPDLHEHVNLE